MVAIRQLEERVKCFLMVHFFFISGHLGEFVAGRSARAIVLDTCERKNADGQQAHDDERKHKVKVTNAGSADQREQINVNELEVRDEGNPTFGPLEFDDRRQTRVDLGKRYHDGSDPKKVVFDDFALSNFLFESALTPPQY